MKKIFTLLLLPCSLQLFAQTRYYVRPDGNDNNYGISWATAFQTLQKALSASASGSEIWVAWGTYYPDEGPGQTDNNRRSHFSLKSGVAVYGGFAGHEYALSQRNIVLRETILSGDLQQNDGAGFSNNGENAYNVVYCNYCNNTTVLDGFTITGGNASTEADNNGGGMRCDDSYTTIRNCTFTRNRAHYYGGGLYNKNSSPAIINCQFTDNYAEINGGGIYNQASSNAKIINCVFTRNEAYVDGGGIYNINSNPTIINSTIAWNEVGSEGGGMYNTNTAHPAVINSILWGNTRSEIYNHLFSSASVSWSIVQGGWTGRGNLDTDPLFTAGFHLQGCSPAINAGDISAVPLNITTDADGASRILLGGVDMGAYEVQQAGIGGTIYVNAKAPAGGDGSSWARALNKLQDALAKAPLCNLPTQVWVAGGTYYPDEGGGKTDNDRTASFVLKNGLALYGDFAGNEKMFSQRTLTTDSTILSGDLLHNDGPGFSNNGDNAYHVVTTSGVNSTAVLDGFIITGGNANGSGAQYLGGGMYNLSSSPTLVRCSFVQNGAGNGGGLYNQAASPALSYCSFSGNIANFGAGVYNQSTTVPSNSNPTFTGCHFVGNTAKQEGGGIYNLSSGGTLVNCDFWANNAVTGAGLLNQYTTNLRLTNCTFANNRATSLGGALYNLNTWDSRPTLTNCILWGDLPEEISGEGATITYSLVGLSSGVYPGTGNLNMDPQFQVYPEWNPHLQSTSPAINNGDNEAVAGIPYDGNGEGYNRIYGDRVDMGAYEWQLAAGPHEPGPYKPLILVCPGDITLASAAGDCGVYIDFYAAELAAVDGGTLPLTVTYSPASGDPLPIGENTITVTAIDGANNTRTCSFTISVVDTTSPVITGVSATPAMLYPPNHKMQEVQVNYTVSDNCPGVTTNLSVTSNEPEYGNRNGDTGPDWEVVNDHKVKLRSERSGYGSDRMYTITITATDAAGSTATATTTVTVPHDKSRTRITTQNRIDTEVINDFTAQVFPNPTPDGFTITTQSSSMQPISIQVMDNLGRMVERRTGLAANASVYLGSSYRPGMYFVEIVQGDTVRTIKVVKQTR
jgi:hypothetical protein